MPVSTAPIAGPAADQGKHLLLFSQRDVRDYILLHSLHLPLLIVQQTYNNPVQGA